MKKYNRIVFITDSGTGRAPMAEAILKSMDLEHELEICSRGIVVLFPEPLNQKTELILNLKNLHMDEHKSVPLSEEDFTSDSLIVTMEGQQKEKIQEQFGITQNVVTLKELAGEEGDIRSPYGEPLSVYSECFNLLERLLQKAKNKLNMEE